MRADAAGGPFWLRPLVCTAVGLAGNILLTIAKIIVGMAARSTALIADGFHSLADVASDIGIVLAIRTSQRPPDDNHPYGHHGFETLGAVGVALLMILTGLLIGKDAVTRLWTGEFLHPRAPALIISLISVVLKEGMARYTLLAGRRHGSPALLTNGAMHRSDALSSLAASVAVLGALLGVPALDSIGALVIALFIVRMGWRLGTANVMTLMDTMPDRDLIARMLASADSVSGAREMRDIRVRQRGSTYHVELRMAVDPELTVGHAHDIAHAVEERLMQDFPAVTHVLVHVEPSVPVEH
jgi:cation diffusion facilitator family transporter